MCITISNQLMEYLYTYFKKSNKKIERDRENTNSVKLYIFGKNIILEFDGRKTEIK